MLSPRHAVQQEPSRVMLLLICRRSCPTLLCCAAAVQPADLLELPSDQPAICRPLQRGAQQAALLLPAKQEGTSLLATPSMVTVGYVRRQCLQTLVDRTESSKAARFQRAAHASTTRAGTIRAEATLSRQTTHSS